MSRTLDQVVLDMIRAYVGRPCPTTKTVMEWTGLPRRRVWAHLAGMAARGLIELECRHGREAGRDPKMRRLRVTGEAWTCWTARPGRPVRAGK